MSTAIIGAGASGLTFAGLLNGDVTLLTHSKRQSEQLLKEGWTLATHNQRHHFFCPAQPLSEVKRQFKTILICTKATDLINVFPHLKSCITPTTQLLFLQNGCVDAIIAAQNFSAVTIRGLNYWGARREKDTVICRNRGRIIINGNCDPINPVIISALGIESAADFQRSYWVKLIVNCCINPLSVRFRCTNGDLLKQQYFEAWCRHLIDETLALVPGQYAITADEAMAAIIDVCRKTADNKSSMLQDILGQRQTEIQFLNQHIASTCHARGLPSWYNKIISQTVEKANCK